MSRKPRIAVIYGSTRPTRFVEKPGKWITDLASAREDWDVEVLDLRDYDLPFFDEMASNLWMPSQNEKAVAWQNKLATFDGFIFVIAEYNHSITGALKNAIDQSYKEWNHKAMAIVGYGGVGAARAAEHLRGIAIEVQMVPVRSAVHIGGGDFFAVSPLGANGEMSTIEANVLLSAKAMLDDLDWWTRATMTARDAG